MKKELPKRVLTPHRRKVWCKALRSGKFKQGSEGRLKTYIPTKIDWEYCCLGVAKEVISGRTITESYGSNYFLPNHHYGLSTALQEALATANDGEKLEHNIHEQFRCLGYPSGPRLYQVKTGEWHATFKSIAAWIEKYL
jgi:hypothetical protein